MRYFVRNIEADTKYPAATYIHQLIGENQWRVFGEDENNADYKVYLAWLAEGNEPEPWNPDTINGGEE